MAHLSERKVCARVKWILSVTSRLSCRVFNPHFGTFGKYSDKFGFRKNWMTVTSRHFTIIMSCIQSTLRNIGWIFGQIRFSEKFGRRITVAFGHTLFFIPLIKFEFFYNILLKICFHLNICHHQIHKKFFKISFLWIVMLAKMIVACSLERRWIGEGTRHRPERLAWNNVDSHWPVCVDWTGGRICQSAKFALVSNE